MQQSKKGSLLEALTNLAIGYVVGVLSQFLVFPFFGATFTFTENLWISVWFSLIALIRSYLIRRLFNKEYFRKLFGKQA